MVLTAKQEEALKITVSRFKNGEPYTCIAGYAGTGKSTVIPYIIEALGVDPDLDVAYCAFTGKAATVLAQKGCANAITAHKLIYWADEKSDGTFNFRKRKVLEVPCKIVVVDEVSMLPKQMWEDLLSFKTYVIALGDPFQLPTINPKDDNGVLQKPHVFLDEVMRQAKENEIIRLTMGIRNMQPLSIFRGNDVQIFQKEELTSGMLLWSDIVLCATNQKRTDINSQVRELLGKGEAPEIGDKIIGLHNEWNVLSSEGSPLTNGVIGQITSLKKVSRALPRNLHFQGKMTYLQSDILTENNETFNRIGIDYNFIMNGEKTLTNKQKKALSKNPYYENSVPYEFAYGYAITVHKAQGSQWDKVLVLEEWFPNDPVEHARWVYTAATRAAQKLVIIKR